MNSEEQHAVPPPAVAPAGAPAAKPAGKSKVPMIVAVVLALLVVRWMFSGPSKTTATGSAADSASASAGGDAPAADTGGNPVIGRWALVDPADAAYCPTTEEFTADNSTWMQNGQTYHAKPIYDIKPGVTVVGYGTSYMGEWRPTGPDDMTLGQVGPPPYGVPSFCKYHRQ